MFDGGNIRTPATISKTPPVGPSGGRDNMSRYLRAVYVIYIAMLETTPMSSRRKFVLPSRLAM